MIESMMHVVFYGALIVAALRGETKDDLLDEHFYQKHKTWFGGKPLHQDIQKIVEGSYKTKKNGYEDGIRGKGFVVDSLEAALWAFCFDDDSFKKGALAAVNLGDDTDTTAAIYGQLAGTYYGYKSLPQKWVNHVYARDFIMCLSEWIVYEGQRWSRKNSSILSNSHSNFENHSHSNTHSTLSNVQSQQKKPSQNRFIQENKNSSEDR